MHIKTVFSGYDTMIAYKPLNNEIDFKTISFFKKKFINKFYLPNNKNSDLLLLADYYTNIFVGKKFAF